MFFANKSGTVNRSPLFFQQMPSVVCILRCIRAMVLCYMSLGIYGLVLKLLLTQFCDSWTQHCFMTCQKWTPAKIKYAMFYTFSSTKTKTQAKQLKR